jgi:hypothetical protein
MVVLGMVPPIIGFLARITAVSTGGLIARVVGIVLILSAQPVTRPAVAAITDNAPQWLRRPWRARRLGRPRLRDHRPGPMVMRELRGPLGWNG